MTSVRKWIERLVLNSRQSQDEYWAEVRCNRCQNIVRARIDLRNELSLLDEDDTQAHYYCRKILVGQAGCFQRMEVELFFDAQRNLVKRQVVGGQFTET